MKLILTFLLLLCSYLGFSQQMIELCENEPTVTYTYWVESTGTTNLIWWVNGYPYHTQDLTITWDSVGVYDIVVTSDVLYSCPSDTQKIQVTVTKCDQLIYYVPNAFSPDGDDYNNTFQPVFTEGFDPYDFHMSIYNRWGELLFESYDASKGWNGYYGGIRCQDGVYTWKIDFGLPDNTDERIVTVGHVVLIR